MRLKTAQKYVEKILPVLVENIQAKYHPNFVAPEIEFDNSWRTHGTEGYYSTGGGEKKIIIKRTGRICAESLASTLSHELGHALLEQTNPEFYNPEFYWARLRENEDYDCLDEGIADILEIEGEDVLMKKRLFSGSVLDDWRIWFNKFLSLNYWRQKLKGKNNPYYQGDVAVCHALDEKKDSLVEIMEQVHNSQFAQALIGA